MPDFNPYLNQNNGAAPLQEVAWKSAGSVTLLFPTPELSKATCDDDAAPRNEKVLQWSARMDFPGHSYPDNWFTMLSISATISTADAGNPRAMGKALSNADVAVVELRGEPPQEWYRRTTRKSRITNSRAGLLVEVSDSIVASHFLAPNRDSLWMMWCDNGTEEMATNVLIRTGTPHDNF